MKRFTLLLLMAFLSIGWAAAQTTVSGKVTGADDGAPIPGATVAVKGFAGVGTITDFDGKFKIDVPKGGTHFLVSFVGYKETEVAIDGKSTIDVTLQRADVGLEEVIVVAYGTQTKRATTGAITSVDSEVIENQITVSPLSSIQGVAAGVNVITTGGQPGENPTIRIRGIGSVNASSDPLIVLDGVVFSGNMNSISSDQIESINVLKDASATSLYGSRAANGVILISTKGGGDKPKPTTVSVTTKYGFSSPAVDNYDLIGAEDGMKYSWEALRNAKLYADSDPVSASEAAQYATDNLVSSLGYNPYSGTEKPVGTDGQIVPGAALAWDTDWYDALLRDNAYFNEHSVGIEGGNGKISYYFSGSYLGQDGGIIESKFERYSGRFNIKAKLNDWLAIGTNTSYSQSTQNYPNQSGSSYTNGMQWVNTLSSIYPLFARDNAGDYLLDANGNKEYDFGNRTGGLVNATRPILGGDNAVASTQNHTILYKRSSLFSTNYLDIKFSKNFSFRSTFGYENFLYDANEYTHYKYGHASSVGGRVDQSRNITTTKSFINGLKYQNEFGKHKVSADVISELFELKYDYLQAQGTGFLPDVKVLSGSTVPEGIDGFVNSSRMVSYLGRVNYGFNSKYFAEVSVRRDASSQFSDGNRWGTFYSVGGSWIISDEEFLPEIFDLFKLRVSYGELGNNSGIGYFPYLSAYATGWNNNNNTGVLQGDITDYSVSWEKSALFNLALDFGVWNNRFTGTLEYYSKKSIDLLFDQPLAPSSGDKKIFTNIGSMVNNGFELILNSVNIHTKDLYWTSSFNIATNHNELTELPQDEILNGSKKWMVGKSVYDFYIEDYAGVDPETGDALWWKDIQAVDAGGDPVFDENGDPVFTGEKEKTNNYDDASRYYVGSSLPKFTGGLSSYFRYKDFDLNIMFNYSFGGKIYDYTYAGLMHTGSRLGQQWTSDIDQRWQQPGDITDVPKLTNTNNNYTARSTRFLFDNDYIRLKALSVGYNLPKTLIGRVKINDCRLYLQASNIWTWQTHKGIDPEQNLAGTTDDRSNGVKTWTLGLNVKF